MPNSLASGAIFSMYSIGLANSSMVGWYTGASPIPNMRVGRLRGRGGGFGKRGVEVRIEEKSSAGDRASLAARLAGLFLGAAVEVEVGAEVSGCDDDSLDESSEPARSEAADFEPEMDEDFPAVVLSAANAVVLLARAPGLVTTAAVLRPLIAAPGPAAATPAEELVEATGPLNSSSSLKTMSMDD